MAKDGAEFIRVLGRGDILALAFGAMVGFGWVVLTGDFLNDAGSLGSALAFLIGGTIVGLVGLTYAELVSAMPRAGGEHQYALRGLGARGGFVASWGMVLGYLTVVAFEAVALPETILYLFPDMQAGHLWTVAGYDVHATWAAVGIVAAVVMTALNYLGIRPSAIFQTIAVLFLLGVAVFLTLGSAVGGSTEHMTPLFAGGTSGLLVVLVATPFLFVGFDVIPQSAEEVNLPYRQVGRVLVLSVACATAWYILIMLTVSSALSRPDLLDAELASADGMAALWNSQTMGNLLVLGGIAGILTSWNAFLVGSSRLIFAMARSGMLPEWLGRLHPRFKTPGNALLVIGALSVIAPLFGEEMLTWLVNAGSVNIVVAYIVVTLTFLVLRRREPQMSRPFRVPAGPVIGVVALVLSLGLAVLYLPGMPSALVLPYEWVIVGAWWLVGLILIWRLPRIHPGADAEDRLIRAVREGSPSR
ncbi:amino acid transporter [Lipingzhangella halophila]|uniref:Amino acid transporter n=1 Tax=Lipingzhangella halophila TaxID=1783352 RepID=A0A7W7RHV4_9ACTN|nr:APC family permease [Lipingzhangella halophila]MBB4932253.1 amino acid transporter [Lipingzhangella halophila]